MVVIARALLASIVVLSGAWRACEASEPLCYVGSVIQRVPRSDEELAEAHRASLDVCQPIGSSQPLATFGFCEEAAYRVSDDNSLFGGEVVSMRACRRGVISLGTTMTSDDRARLPFLTSRRIQDRVDSNYLSLQARLHRENDGCEAYLYDRLLAAVCRYDDDASTDSFARLTQAAIREVRSLGLWVRDGAPLSPRDLRTLVAVYKTSLAVTDPVTRALTITPNYELILVRAREAAQCAPAEASGGATSSGCELELHGFGTSDGRTRLHYFALYAAPNAIDECHVQSTVAFTEFALGQQYPTARATREATVRSRASYSKDELDRFVASLGLDGDMFDHLNDTLDAVIDGRVAVGGAAAAGPGR